MKYNKQQLAVRITYAWCRNKIINNLPSVDAFVRFEYSNLEAGLSFRDLRPGLRCLMQGHHS